MNEPKNHHLLPAFYLQGFCDRRRHRKEGHDQNPRNLCNVYVHDRERPPDEQGRKCRLRGVNNVAVKKHFNSADVPGGGRDAEPEMKLAIIDGHASRILRDLRYGGALVKEDRAWLARFIAYAKFRTPSYREWLEDFATATYPEMRRRFFPTVTSIEEYMKAKGYPVDGIPRSAFKAIYRDVHEDRSALKVDKNYILLRMFEMGDKTASILFGYDWTFAWAVEDTSFITSDDPFLVLDEDLEAPPGFVGEARITTPNSKKVFPLSQEICLVVGTGAPADHHIKIDRPTVRKINLAQARHYDRWLIAKDQALCERFASEVASRVEKGGQL